MYSTALVRQMVLHFAELAGWDGDKYLVTLSRKTFDRAAKRRGTNCIEADDLGATVVDENDRPEPEPRPVTWISPDIKNFRLLADICAHEALHAAHPRTPHGPAFEKSVRALLRGQEP
jgi:hypothetical protein